MGYKTRSKLFSSKGSIDIDLWFNAFELAIVFIVAVVLIQTVNFEVKAKTYDKLYLSRDNSLLVNTIYSGPGDVRYSYQEKTQDFIFDFKQNELRIYEESELKEGAPISYPFAENNNHIFFYNKLDSRKQDIIYSKNNNEIRVTND